MEHRLGMRAPAARRKLPAWWQGSHLLGICDARGVWLQNAFPTQHTRGSESSQVTKVCPYLLLTKELAAIGRRRGTLSFIHRKC